MPENLKQDRSAPPLDSVERLKAAINKAPPRPTLHSWADVVRQCWAEIRVLVLHQHYRPKDVAAILQTEFGQAFDEDYIRRLLKTESKTRRDKEMLKSLGHVAQRKKYPAKQEKHKDSTSEPGQINIIPMNPPEADGGAATAITERLQRLHGHEGKAQ